MKWGQRSVTMCLISHRDLDQTRSRLDLDYLFQISMDKLKKLLNKNYTYTLEGSIKEFQDFKATLFLSIEIYKQMPPAMTLQLALGYEQLLTTNDTWGQNFQKKCPGNQRNTGDPCLMQISLPQTSLIAPSNTRKLSKIRAHLS